MKTFAEYTTIHGFYDLYLFNSSLMRLGWLGLLAVTIGTMVHQGGSAAFVFDIKGSSNTELTALWQIKEAQYVNDNHDTLYIGEQHTSAALPRDGKHLQYDPDPAVVNFYYFRLSVRLSQLQNLRRRPCLDYYSADERYDCMGHCVNEQVCVAKDNPCVVFVPGKTDNSTRLCAYLGLYNIAMHCSQRAGLFQWDDRTPFNELNDEVLKCSDICMRQCTTAQYEVKAVVTGASENELTSTDAPHSSVAIMFASGESNLVMEEQMVYTPAGFLASLGGTISLFCGASVVSILQIVWISLGLSTKKLVPLDSINGSKKSAIMDGRFWNRKVNRSRSVGMVSAGR